MSFSRRLFLRYLAHDGQQVATVMIASSRIADAAQTFVFGHLVLVNQGISL